ncbi:MAG TPA: PBP1A family penicillin-binding protein [Candidatus Binatia bacterium]|nr:PBP1A family penicillin-binding protein [Candidatus Binatia bacterium]
MSNDELPPLRAIRLDDDSSAPALPQMPPPEEPLHQEPKGKKSRRRTPQERRRRRFRLPWIISFLLGAIFIGGTLAAIAGWMVYIHYSEGLPDYYQLASYDPPVVSRVYAGDGRLLAEYAVENRVFVPITAIPKRVINAFLSAEDKSFYSHPGIDVPSMLKAAWINLLNYGRDRRPIGASTITQQVTKNFLLSNELSYGRKIKEAILALRIEKAFSKDRILELYLNQIYLGSGNYGVAAASLNYFNKSLNELTIGEAAYLASLPKAPNNYNIKRNPVQAKDRRDWVIDRMLENGDITAEEASAAKLEPLVDHTRAETERVTADYFAEEVRRELAQRFGEDALYKKGLTVRSTVDPRLQEIADLSLRRGLVAFDRTQGYRGPLKHVELTGDWNSDMTGLPGMPWLYQWQAAIVLAADKDGARIGLKDGGEGTIPMAELTWARKALPDGGRGPAVKTGDDVLKPGDIVAVEAVQKDKDGKDYPAGSYALRQVPEVSGAFVAMDPHTGRVLAMSGGWSYQQSEFNRATQAMRQPGSSFKPVVYLAALESGFTPSTIILDAPMVIDQGPGLPPWRPENFKQEYFGPATLRLGLENSRNLMTIRVAQTIGMAKVAEMAGRLGVIDNMQQTLAMSIGAGETTVLRMVSAYSMIVNGGKKIEPTFIDRVQDGQGWTIYRHDQRKCDGCQGIAYDGQPPPQLPDDRPQVLDPAIAYQMVSLMEGVVQRGTGTAVKAVGKPLAGKTGTTNDGRDVWFVGYSPDLAAGVYLGYDQPRSLGEKATGGTLSAPIFRDFMMEALKDKPATPFRVPPGIRLVRVNYKTGQRAQPGDEKVIWEAFRPGTEPNGQPQQVVEGTSLYGQDAGYGSVIPLDNQAQGQQQSTDAVPQDNGTSILDMPDQQPQLTYQAPGQATGAPGESSNPSDYHPSQATTPNGVTPANQPAGTQPDAAQPGQPASQIGDNGSPPPLPSTAEGLNNPPSGGDNGAAPAPAVTSQQPAPATTAPADSSQGLY